MTTNSPEHFTAQATDEPRTVLELIMRQNGQEYTEEMRSFEERVERYTELARLVKLLELLDPTVQK